MVSTEFHIGHDFLGDCEGPDADYGIQTLRGKEHFPGIRMIGILIVALGTFCASMTEGQDLREAFKRVKSSVVIINTIQDVIANPQNQRASVAELGSGVLISKDGEILTAAHLVQTADAVFVRFSSGDVIVAKVIASEPAADVALLKLTRPPPSGAAAAKLGDSDQTDVADQIFIVGAPHGIGHTLTVGYISGRRRSNFLNSGLSMAEFFQTDAAINQGNSGGPMFNMAGEVVGDVSAIISKSGGSEGLGFVATSNMARQLLLEQKSFWSGVSGYFISTESARLLNIPPPRVGMLIQYIAKNSPAALMGLRGGTTHATVEGENVILGGDVILTVQGIPFSMKNYEKIQDVVTRLGPGDIVSVKILRGGEHLELRTKKNP
jgi:S1-C subfamily serine protease